MLNRSTQHPAPQLLSDYVHGRMSDHDSVGIQQHLEYCEECCEVLKDMNDSGIERLLRSAESRFSADICLPGNAAHATAAVQTSTSQTADDRYKIMAQIGRGGMGVVYRARDRQLCRDVAVKTLQEGRCQPSFRDRFVREAQITAMLDHPGVPATHELGHFADGRPFMAMRLVKGETLQSCLEGAPDPDAMLQIFGRLCDCVAFAHSQQIIHRDIKPANVMVGEFGEVQVMDWGLAKYIGAANSLPALETTRCADESAAIATGTTARQADSRTTIEHRPATGVPEDQHGKPGYTKDSQATRTGTVLGTAAYMSPEQAQGQIDNITPASDVYSLGALLCEILTGLPPHTGPNEAAKLRSARGGVTTELTDRLSASNADPALIDLAQQCLARSPEDRPKDATVVARRLDEWQHNVRKRLDDARMAQARSEAKVVEQRKRQRMQLALIAVSLLSVGIVWLLYTSMRSQELEYATRENDRRIANIASANTELKMFTAALHKAIEHPGMDDALWEEAKIHLTHATDLSRRHDDPELTTTIAAAKDDYDRAHDESTADDVLLDQLRQLDAMHGHPDGPAGRHGPPPPHGAGPRPPHGTEARPPRGDGPPPPHDATHGPPPHSEAHPPGFHQPPHSPPHFLIAEMAGEIEHRGCRAFADYGFDPQWTTPDETARHLHSRPQLFRDEMVRHLEVWLHYAIVGQRPTAPWINDVLKQLDSDPFRSEVRQAMLHHDREVLMDVAQDSEFQRQPAEFVWSVAALIRQDSHELANQLMAAAQLNHLDSSVINRDLAHELQSAGKIDEATSVLMLRAATQQNPTAKANALLELANSFRSQQRHQEAITVLRHALRDQPDIIPEEVFTQNMSLIPDTEFIVSLLSSMLEEGTLDSADAWIELGHALQKQNDWHAASEAYRKGLAIRSPRESRNEQAQSGLEHCLSMMTTDSDPEGE